MRTKEEIEEPLEEGRDEDVYDEDHKIHGAEQE